MSIDDIKQRLEAENERLAARIAELEAALAAAQYDCDLELNEHRKLAELLPAKIAEARKAGAVEELRDAAKFDCLSAPGLRPVRSWLNDRADRIERGKVRPS